MTQETYEDHTRDKFGSFQDEWDLLAKEQADRLAQMLARRESRLFCWNDGKQIKQACAELIIAIEEMETQGGI